MGHMHRDPVLQYICASLEFGRKNMWFGEVGEIQTPVASSDTVNPARKQSEIIKSPFQNEDGDTIIFTLTDLHTHCCPVFLLFSLLQAKGGMGRCGAASGRARTWP